MAVDQKNGLIVTRRIKDKNAKTAVPEIVFASSVIVYRASACDPGKLTKKLMVLALTFRADYPSM